MEDRLITFKLEDRIRAETKPEMNIADITTVSYFTVTVSNTTVAEIRPNTWLWSEVVYIFWGLFSITGNSLTLLVIFKYDELQTTSNFLVVSLSLADLLAGATGTPLTIINKTSSVGSSLWVTTCILREISYYISCSMNAFSISWMSVDRLIYIEKPFEYHELVTKKRLLVGLIISWLYIIILMTSIVLKVKSSLKVFEFCEIVPGSDWYNFVIVPHFVFFTILAIVAYSRISFIAFQQSKRIHNQSMDPNEGSSAQMKITKMMAMVVGTYLALYVPVIVCGLFLSFNGSEVGSNILQFVVALYNANTWINPVIYGFKNKDIRKGYKKIVFCKD